MTDGGLNLIEMTAANTPNNSFGTGGEITALNTSQLPGSYNAVTVSSDSNIVVGGIAGGVLGSQYYFTRYNSEGSLDTTFGTAGATEISFAPLQALAGLGSGQDLQLMNEPDGKIIAAGNLGSPIFFNGGASAFGVARMNPDGTLDATFGNGGMLTFPGDENPSLMWQDNKLLIGSNNTIRRFNDDGTLDSSFATGISGGSAFAVQPDGKIVDGVDLPLNGQSVTNVELRRYTANGNVDTSFGNNGTTASTAATGFNGLVVEPGGTIVASINNTDFVTTVVLKAFNANGSTDTAFGSGGTVTAGSSQISGNNVVMRSVVQQPNGQLLTNITYDFAFASDDFVQVSRYSAQGQLDTAFGNGGTTTLGSVGGKYGNDNVSIQSIATLDSAGRLLLVGGNGPTGANILALQTTGTAVPGPVTQVLIQQQPTLVDLSGYEFVLALEDASGALVTTDTTPFTIALSGDTSGATISFDPTAGPGPTAQGGFVVFNDIRVTPGDAAKPVGTGYTLTATSDETSPITSAPFDIVGPAVFAQQPSGFVSAGTLPAVVVNLLTPDGTLDTTKNSSVTLTLSGGATGATLGGTTTVTAVNGVATFNDLSIIAVGNNYVLTAAAQTSPPISTAPFNVVAITTPSAIIPVLGKVHLPGENIAGTKLASNVPVVITNHAAALKGFVTVNIFADTGTALDGNEVLVTKVKEKVSLKTGKAHAFNVAIKALPTNLPAGTYHLLTQIVDPSGATSITATTQTVNVVASIIQPTVTVGNVSPANIIAGRSGSVLITITNQGNIAARDLDITLSPSIDGTTPVAGITLATIKNNLVLQPKASKKFLLRFKLPKTFAAGSYTPYVAVTLGGISITAVGTTPFTVG